MTGSFGSGKTTVAKAFERLGVSVIDADSVGHRVIEEEDVKETLIKEFGEEIVENGKINRKTLADIVFSDKAKVVRLNQITHPKILEEIETEIKGLQKRLIVVVAPFLIEAGIIVDKIILVITERKKIIERLKKAGWNEEDVQRRMGFHPEDSERIKRAQFIIDNNGTISETEEQAKEIYSKSVAFEYI